MKNKVKPLSALIALSIVALPLTACTEQINTPATTTDAAATTTLTEKITETDLPESAYNTTEVTSAPQTDQDPVSTKSPLRWAENTNVELFSSPIIDNEGKEYTVRAYIYNINDDGNGDIFPAEEGMTKGWAAIELLYDGEQIFCQDYQVGNRGQTAPSFNMDKTDENFKVLHLNGGDVFVCARTDLGDLCVNQYYRVIDGKLELMERHYTDGERKEIDKDPTAKIHPANAVYEFITPLNFTVEENRLIYKLDSETSGLSSYSLKEGSYAAGEIPLVFDFENNIVKCEKDEYCGLVYYYYDLG